MAVQRRITRSQHRYATGSRGNQMQENSLKHISESDCMMDIDGAAWKQIVEARGGRSCHISPPCKACVEPVTEEELNEVGYTYEGGAA